jgi:hypothetical protein
MSETCRSILLVDFDETLFEHAAHAAFLGKVISDRLGVDPTRYLETFPSYHRFREGVGKSLYAHKKHVLDTVGVEWSVLSGLVQEEVGRQGAHFCYADAHEFLDSATTDFSSVRILTYGREAYQRYKIGLCPQTATLPVHVVCEPKRDFLASNFPVSSGVSGVLVDDRKDLCLPSNWRHVWINRSGEKVQSPLAPYAEAHSLDFEAVKMAMTQ